MWKCPGCESNSLSSRPYSRTAQNAVILVGQVVGATPPTSPSTSKKRCLICDRTTRSTARPLICAGCLRERHKSCSGLSRLEQEMYISVGTWSCPNCSTNHSTTGITRPTNAPTAIKPSTEVKIRSSLSIVQWNANGIKSKMVELESMARKLDTDIILIQESKLRSADKDPKITGYETVRKDRDVGMWGGLVTFIKDDIPFIAVNHALGLPESKLEALIIDVNPASLHRMTCVNVYEFVSVQSDGTE